MCPTCSVKADQGVFSQLELASGGQSNTRDEHILSLLRTSYFPSDDVEKSPILFAIQDCEKDIEILDTQIGRLMSTVTQLQKRRSDAERTLSYHAGILSPIRQLPDELLGEIMLFSTSGRTDVHSRFSAAWRLEKVCKRWQVVALSLQEMWASIDVYLGGSTAYQATVSDPMVARLVQLCIQRSQERSLSIRFMEIGSHPLFHAILDLLSSSSQRWEEISLSLSLLSSSPVFENGLNRLRILGLSGLYPGGKFGSFQHAQQLTQLRLSGIHYPFRFLILPWSQITYLKLVYCEFRTGEFMSLLQHLPKLSHFISRWNKGLSKNLPSTIKPIHLQHLKVLELDADPVPLWTLLNPLHAPSLKTLYVVTVQRAGNYSYSQISDSIVSAIRGSGCSLSALSLSSVNSECACDILDMTPSLTSLRLEYIQDAAVILQHLSRQPVLPMLRRLTLSCSVNQGADIIWSLVSFVEAWSDDHSRNPTYPLGTIDVTFREERGVGRFTSLLNPLSVDTGVVIVINTVRIGQ